MPLGVLFMIFHTPSSDSRGWKGSCLFGTQFGFQTQKVTEFISWLLLLLLLRETPASLIATSVLLGFLPTLLGPQVRRYTAQHIPTPLTKEKEIQGLSAKIMSWSMWHLHFGGQLFLFVYNSSGGYPERSEYTFQSRYDTRSDHPHALPHSYPPPTLIPHTEHSSSRPLQV